MDQPEKPWVDPWIEGQRAAADARKATFDGEPPEGSYSRKACVMVGVKTLLACALAAVALPAIGAGIGRPALTGLIPFSLKAVIIVLPLAGLVGAVIALETYKQLVGLRPFREIKWYVWVLLFIFCVQYLILPFLIQYLRRKWIIHDRHTPRLMAPLLYGLLMLLISSICYSAASGHGSRSSTLEVVGLCTAANVLFTLFLGDCLVVNILAKVRNEERLLPPPTHKFQFSLGAMMLTVLGIGAYVSGLVLIFR